MSEIHIPENPFQLRTLPDFKLISKHKTIFLAFCNAAKRFELNNDFRAEVWDVSRPGQPKVLALVSPDLSEP